MQLTTKEIIYSLVEARLALQDDAYMFGTIGDKPKDLKSRIGDFVKSGQAQSAIHHGASKVFQVVKDHHKSMLTTAVAMGLYHVAPHHADVVLNSDTEHAIHHEIEHLATNLSITKTMAHHAMMHAVGKMREMRGIAEASGDKDDELDATLRKLHEFLKKVEPQYRDKNEKPKQDEKPKSK
jgi:hypothetical protein